MVAGHGRVDRGDARALVRLPWLAALAAALQLLAGLAWLQATGFASEAVLTSHVLVAIWFVANAIGRHGLLRHAMAIAAFGWMLNVAVMLPNGGMPVSSEARASIGFADADVTVGQLSKHVELTDSTVLPALADVHPLPQLGMVYSAGDVVLALGLILAVGAIVLPRRAASGTAHDPRIGRLEVATTHVQ
ncbi:MAG: hypothetical protein AVDCRST_MAG50-193 [uncultured Acidimicrobiales bacterium]|uniref:DUF5317 domain-containing protein n=1 Tax=uncultured Acidimicrobiales bacterium TaxID=310071 RepID=A0A6J4H6Z4_9ACTN|nr:MAG: hypothetical protein AVDCRST_MAG50-193 [uncultured Acidimicrobiales bacterium]